MILADSRLLRLAKHCGLVTPFNPDMIQPASVEVTLGGPGVVVWRKRAHASPTDGVTWSWHQVERPLPYKLMPDDHVVLATTAETIRVPNDLAAKFNGKSSLGRLGISTHVTAGFIDPGFTGQITLELLNGSPVPFVLEEGMKIGQIVFSDVSGKVLRPYGQAGNHYQNQTGPTLADENSLKRPGSNS